MIKKISTSILALASVLVLFSACKKEYESIESIDKAKIEAYIRQNNLNMIKDSLGFYYQVIEQGTGSPLLNKDSVFYVTRVKSLSGNSYYTPPNFSAESTYLGYVKPDAYRTALYAINRGGKVRLIVPSHLAYGKNGSGIIPPNEIIVTDLEVFPYTKQWEMDDRIINDFLTANKLIGVKHPSRVYYIISQEGTGTVVDASSTITVKYKGRYLNGTVFDQTVDDASRTADLNDYISGWKKVLVGMKKGTKVRIFVPSDLAYGVSGNESIPPNTVLDFDIELVDVVNQ